MNNCLCAKKFNCITASIIHTCLIFLAFRCYKIDISCIFVCQMYIMSWMVKFQSYFFLSVAFLLGSVAPLYGNVFNFLLLIFVLLLWWKNGKQVWTNLMSERLYIGVNVAFLLYFSLHTIIVLLKGNPIAKPSYGTFEALALNFVLVPIFVVTWKDWLTPALVKRFLFYFCVGSLLLNLYILLMITGTRLFTAPGEALGIIGSGKIGLSWEVNIGWRFKLCFWQYLR